MSAALEKLKKSRQIDKEVGGKTFTFTRPTPMQAMDWLIGINGDPLSQDDVKKFIAANFSLRNSAWRKLAQYAVEHFVVDWSGMKEMDIIPGGDGSPIQFDRELFLLWIEDYPETITTLGFSVFEAWISYLEAQKEAEKKPDPGLNPDT